MMRIFSLIAVLGGLLFFSGCVSTPEAPISYDFGPQPEQSQPPRLKQPLLVHDVRAAAWMESPQIYYRLAYRDATKPLAYIGSRWVMPPTALLTLRLRRQLGAVSSGGIILPGDSVRSSHALRIELEEFAQVFDAPERSRAVVRIRASLFGSRDLIAQRSFVIERPTASPDSQGGVLALIGASDEAIGQIIDWTVQNVKD